MTIGQAESGERLRDRASAVLSAIELRRLQNAPDRPLFVEFSGTPKSGKSSCIDIVAHFFRRLRFRVLAPTEGASRRTPYYLKDDWVAFNAWSACYALTHVLEGVNHADRYHIAILDRGLFDALVWFELLSADRKITEDFKETVHDFLLLDKWRSVIDLVLLFKADPDTSMERENQNTLISDPGRAMNPDLLRSLNDAYDRVREKYAAEFSRFELIDTSKEKATTPTSTALRVVELILERLEGASA